MSIDVNAIEQTVVVTAVGDEVNVNIIDQPVLVSVTDQIIEVEASGGTGPQGPAGAGVAAGGTTGQVLSKASNTNYDTVWVDAGAGTVYSVDASGSTGISVTGGPITGAGVLTITNTLPDQVVSLTGAGTAVITGTYPNFTITTNDEFDGTVTSVNLTAGTGISVSGGPITSSGAINVVNTAPDQVVSLTGGGTTTISGTYPNFTISSADQYSGTVTSVNMTVPTGLTISGNPITSAGTLALALASGYSIPTTASQANWNTAYNDSITSASVSGTSTKTLTLNQQDGGTVTASWSDIDTGLTSVGLTMPSAFAVSNSPLTSNGTIAVTGAGNANQYVRGDGALATFPSNAGGGSSVSYYLNGSVNASVAGYRQMDFNAIVGGGTDFTLVGNGLIAQFLTDVGNPNRIQIPGGAWNMEMYFQVSSSGGNQKFYVDLLKYDGSTFTLIASTSAVPEEITGGTTIDLYLTSIAVPTTTLLATDRLAIRVYIIDNAVGRTITLHTENNTLCEIITTFAGGVASLNGLTANTQYFATGTSGTDFNIQSLTDTHTFNLPVASGSNTGKLSNVDWLTFDGKENVLTFSAPLSRSVNTVSIPVATTSQPGYLDSTDWTTFNAKVTSVSATSPLFSTGGKTPTLTIQQASGSQNGYLSSTDWTTFNNKQNAITLTTTGASGSSTFIGSTLNIPTYTLTGLGGVPTTRQLTINGTAYDLSADRSWNIPVHDAVTIGTANGLSLSTQVLSLGLSSSSTNGALSSTDWSAFNGKQNAITLTTTGTTGAATLVGATLNIPQYADQYVGTVTSVAALTLGTTGTDLSSTVANGTTTPVITLNVPTASATNRGALSSADWTTFNSKQAALNGTGFVKISGTTISYDNTSYLPLTGGTLSSASSAETLRLINTGTGYGLYNQSDSYFQGDVKFQSVSNTILKVDSSNKLIAAVAGTDYQAPITNPVTGTGTTNYLPKWTSGSAIGNSTMQDDGTNVSITGGFTANSFLRVFKNGSDSLGSGPFMALYNAGATAAIFQQLNASNGLDWWTTFGKLMTLTSSGNLLVNSTTDNGNRLQVTGNGYFSGNVGINTTTLGERLNVNGGLGFQSSGTQNWHIASNASNNLVFTRSGIADRMTLSSDGNLGLGVVPSAWGSGYKAIQAGSQSAFVGYSGNFTWVSTNALFGASSNTYIESGYATTYRQTDGTHAWYTAPSGTAGNAITFTQAMTLTASGRLLLGTTTEGTYLLDVNGTGRFSANVYVNDNSIFGLRNSVNEYSIQYRDLDFRLIGSNDASTQRLFSFGYYTSNNIAGTWNSKATINSYTGAATFSSSVTANGGMIVNGYSTASSGLNLEFGITSGYTQFNSYNRTTSSFAGMRIDGSYIAINSGSGGNLLVGTSVDSGYKLEVNGLVKASGAILNSFTNAITGSNLELGYDGTHGVIQAYNRTSPAWIPLYFAGTDMRFNPGGVEKMRIKSNGSVRYIPMATPGTAEAGDVYYDSTSNKLRCYNGTSWNDLF